MCSTVECEFVPQWAQHNHNIASFNKYTYFVNLQGTVLIQPYFMKRFLCFTKTCTKIVEQFFGKKYCIISVQEYYANLQMVLLFYVDCAFVKEVIVLQISCVQIFYPKFRHLLKLTLNLLTRDPLHAYLFSVLNLITLFKIQYDHFVQNLTIQKITIFNNILIQMFCCSCLGLIYVLLDSETSCCLTTYHILIVSKKFFEHLKILGKLCIPIYPQKKIVTSFSNL
eukprot:TRINITY_DN24621_c0_g1_i5.p1 TRINITY_DN24621_c0_g1~~TRINITY_DN24621_c0_g1_i5.p1  ORF type:complete len:225 (-),score=-7.24 TRINITY_DN24621_c0_g1_i5:33-707(-)